MRPSATYKPSRVASSWLRKIVVGQMGPSPKYKKLAIFDFDGTLFRSPPPPVDYSDGEAWWSDPKSLGPSMVGPAPGKEMWHPDSIARLQEAIKDPETYTVVMTGRNTVLRDRIKELLESAGAKPDELITNPAIGNTSAYKRDEMLYLMHQLPRLQEIEFWEDKKADLKGYQRAAEKAGMSFTPKLVKNYEDELPPYVGVFLTPEAKKEILRDFPAAHPNVQADHVTLLFKPTEEQMEDLRSRFKMGQSVPLKVTGVAQDDKAQALSVELPAALEGTSKGRPHVTVSVADGVSPMYSNELLEAGSRAVGPRTYEGYLDVGPRPGSPAPPSPSTSAPEKPKAEKQRLWQEFLQTETRNPNFGKPGHHKEQVRRKTLYDAGGAGRRQVMREWGPFLQNRRSR